MAASRKPRKRFDGKLYARFPIPETTRAKAQASAKRLRARGTCVRVVKEDGRYYLYGRK